MLDFDTTNTHPAPDGVRLCPVYFWEDGESRECEWQYRTDPRKGYAHLLIPTPILSDDCVLQFWAWLPGRLFPEWVARRRDLTTT